MQTAIDKLKSEIQKMQQQCENDYQCGYQNALNEVVHLVEQAKQMEKEQIIEAFDCDGSPQPGEVWISNGEQYYNETYNK